MIRIGIDGNEANVERRVGISEYAYQLLLHFSNKTSDIDFRVFLKNKPLPSMPAEASNFTYEVVAPSRLWTQVGLPIRLFRKKNIDLFFTTTHYAPRFCPVPTVVSIMDLSYLHFPELFDKKDLYQLKNWTKYSAKRARKIITISRSSKNDIMKYYSIPENKIEVVYPGIKAIESKTMITIPAKYNIKGDFLLYIGTLQPRKNLVRLIEAFSMLKNKDLTLVIIGKKGWQFEEILAAPEKFSVTERVTFLDFVPDADLPAFYQNALCYVLPSLYEGFGLPILEAMQYGCPVITSNISSLPEAGGDAAEYFDPNDTKSIATVIERVISNEALRGEMKRKGLLHIKKFSWEKSARQALTLLEGVVNDK